MLLRKPVDDKFDFKPFGKVIKKNRNIKKLTQAKVAELLGVELPYYARIENSGQHPSLQVFYELIKLLNISVDEIFLPDKEDVKTSKRRAADDLLDGLTDNELEIIIGTIKGIIRSRKK